MKCPSLLKIAAASLAMIGTAYAGPLSWSTSTTTQPLKFLNDSSIASATFTGTFDLTTGANPFNPATMTIDWAKASFAFADNNPNYGSYERDPYEYVDISIEGMLLFDEQEVDGSHPQSNFAWYGKDFTANMLLALKDDGKVQYTVQLQNTNVNKTEDVYLKIAKLEATGDYKTHNVPDSASTSLLLGLGLAGLVAFAKRSRRA